MSYNTACFLADLAPKRSSQLLEKLQLNDSFLQTDPTSSISTTLPTYLTLPNSSFSVSLRITCNVVPRPHSLTDPSVTNHSSSVDRGNVMVFLECSLSFARLSLPVTSRSIRCAHSTGAHPLHCRTVRAIQSTQVLLVLAPYRHQRMIAWL